MDDFSADQAMRIAMGLIRSISVDERKQQIEQGNHNEHLAALSFATHFAWQANDANAVRALIDTAFCLGVRAGQRQRQ